jgi:ppGpp synthetase/RelA/SpoT-type nucleotidyltranferase
MPCPKTGNNILDSACANGVLCGKSIDRDIDELREEDMEWAKPQYSQQEVNWAGKYLAHLPPKIDWKEFDHAVDIVGNFRVVHSFPLNTLQIRLRKLGCDADKDCIVAQRLKRFSSIMVKLRRFPGMKLWVMQDIGGCRAIVNNVGKVDTLVQAFKSSKIKHKLTHEDDYIRNPKESGYRSRHLIYRYYSDKTSVYNGLKIEVQVRTQIQHAWATAVETVDIFTQQALKSSAGRRDWERFFQLMGTEMAYRENTPPVPNTPTVDAELKGQLKECAQELEVDKTLRGFTTALRVAQDASTRGKDADFFLLALNNVEEKLNIVGFRRQQLEQASDAYAKTEKLIRQTGQKVTDAVLVSVDSISNLQRAYPNYFADTSRFLRELRRAIK